jgi:predicted ATP-grasp superfamily ATP-dependent carboligase
MRVAENLTAPEHDSAETLTIIGATTRAAAESARRAFFSPIAADLFADLDLCEICPATRIEVYPHGLQRVIQAEQSGGWIYTGALENYPELVERWSHIRPLYGNPADVLRRIRDPQLVSDSLHRAGLPCPAIASSDTFPPQDGSWIRKPLRSAGGIRVERWTPEAATKPWEFPSYFQQFISGTSISATFVANRETATLLGVTRQLLADNSFRYVGSIGPLSLSESNRRQFELVGQILAAEFQLTGLFGVDAIMNDAGVWPVEINPRYTASVEVLEKSLGIGAVEMHITACRNGSLPKQIPTTASFIVGKLVHFANCDFTVTQDLRNSLPGIADVPQLGTRINQGDPVVTLFHNGNDEHEVEQALRIANRSF